MERITDARHAAGSDANDNAGSNAGYLAACQNALSRLHELVIMHGDTNSFNFLIRGSEAVLIDFDTAKKCDDRDVLMGESQRLEESLRDVSGRGGGGVLCLDAD
ncbi:hypothetical protein BDV19DRAFT_389684 [Aspergillus venezuelensis]